MSDSTNINHLFILLLLATFFALPVFSFQSVLTAIGSRQTLFMSLDSACNERTKQTFSGTTILLTGASGGLGRSLSLQLAHCKAHALVLSGRNEEALKAVESECKALYPEIITHIITCDLSDQESVMNLANSALLVCNGRIDVLVNNGGVSSRSRFLDTKIDVDQKIMQINFFAGAALAKALVPGMVERGFGKVIWISSVQGLCKQKLVHSSLFLSSLLSSIYSPFYHVAFIRPCSWHSEPDELCSIQVCSPRLLRGYACRIGF